jgi:predicted transcriptional regulator
MTRNDARLTFKLPSAMTYQLDRLAREENVSRSSWIRRALTIAMRKSERTDQHDAA